MEGMAYWGFGGCKLLYFYLPQKVEKTSAGNDFGKIEFLVYYYTVTLKK